MSSTLIKNGLLVTMNSKRDVFPGDLRFRDEWITEIGPNLKPQPQETVVDAAEGFVIPGLIQAHVHLCQTLFRGLADDLELLDWLKKKIWPLENAHDADSLRASARLGLLEMQLCGTTSILDMGTVRLHEVVFAEADHAGIRYWGGNCLMDRKKGAGPLYRSTEETLAYCEELIRDWHHRTPLIQYAISPRFVISCTEKMLRRARDLQKDHDLIFHTHASENKSEVTQVKETTGKENILYLQSLGCLGEKTVIAHGIHMSRKEVQQFIAANAGLAHCPSSNLKLASGIAPITDYLKQGMKVGLGADGAPCNNLLDPFVEARTAALLQKPLFGPRALSAREAFALATLGGAKVLNSETRIGSLEVGKCADVVIVRRESPGVATVDDPYSALVYSSSGRDVQDVWVHGRSIVRNGQHQIYDYKKEIMNAKTQLAKLRARAKI